MRKHDPDMFDVKLFAHLYDKGNVTSMGDRVRTYPSERPFLIVLSVTCGA